MKVIQRAVTDLNLRVVDLRSTMRRMESSDQAQVEADELLAEALTCIRRAKKVLVEGKVKDIDPAQNGKDEDEEEDPAQNGKDEDEEDPD